MATNTPGALLAFPNEVIDEILGNLVASFPLPAPTTRSHPSPPKKSPALIALQSIALVSRQWRGPAQRRIVSKLVVRTGTQARAIAASLEDGSLGAQMRELKLFGSLRGSSTVPTASELLKGDCITPEDMLALLQVAPRLAVLELNALDFMRFRQRNIPAVKALSCLATVHTFSIESPPFDSTLELLTTLLPNFPALRSIKHSPDYPIRKFRPRSTSEHPFLETLELDGPSSVSTFLALVPNLPKVASLSLYLYDYEGSLNPLGNLMGPRLRTLAWKSFADSYLTDLLPFLPKCTGLLTLQLSYIEDLDSLVKLLTQIPTVQTLQTRGDHMSVSHLLAALATTSKPAALRRLELVEPFAHSTLINLTISDLEEYEIEVIIVH